MKTITFKSRTVEVANGRPPFAIAYHRPEGATNAVLLLPAIAGIDDYILQRASDLVGEGYAVAVLDYYRGTGHSPDLSTVEKIGAAVDALPDAEVVLDIELAMAWLGQQEFATEKTALLGFCIGGAFAIQACATTGKPACAISYYGQLRNPKKPIDPITLAPELNAPLLLHIGERDRLITNTDVNQFRDAAQRSPAPIEVHTYPGAPHAFDEWHRPAVFRPIASSEAWQRTLTFLEWHLTHHQRKHA